nr:retrovirus-related Pol polyprotein from transposon TNT 1-94 [Tanacetum cinerariifolium]
MATLNSKEIKERSKVKGDDGEGLYVRGRTDRRDSCQSRGKSRSKSRGGRHKCYILQSEDHLKRNYPKNNHKKSTGYVKKDEQPSSNGSIYEDSKSGKVKVINGSKFILSGIRRDNCVYSLDGHAMAGELNVSVEEKDSLAQVWHKRLGHISKAGLQVLEKHMLFGKKSLGSDRLCSLRLIGSVSGGIIRRLTVKKLRTSNGLEFCNWEFERLCIESEIARHLKVSGLSKTFWAEATCTAAYLINRSPSRAIEKKTPMEIWSGHPSDYGMLRIFDCVAYPHDKQCKLQSGAVKCVILGYHEGVKGYRLYRLDDESPKVVTSRNVVFNESVM